MLGLGAACGAQLARWTSASSGPQHMARHVATPAPGRRLSPEQGALHARPPPLCLQLIDMLRRALYAAQATTV